MSHRTLGQYLRALRKAKGLTQEQLAQQAEVSKRSIAYWEKDEFTPNSPEILSVLKVLGVAPQEQTRIFLNLMPLRGEKVVRQGASGQTSTMDIPLPCAGDLLAALRIRRGLTREQAAAQLQTTMVTLGRWENNHFDIPDLMLPLIQNVLNVTPAEIQALRLRMAQLQEVQEPFSLERCNAWVEAFQALCEAPGANAIDLNALALQRKLWLLATQHPAARSALARTIVSYSAWLVWQNRGKEVDRQAQRALSIYAEGMFQDAQVAVALNQLSWCKVSTRHHKPEQGERYLRQWFSRLQHSPAQMHVLADAALYAAQAGKSEMALRYLQDARRVYEASGDATETNFKYLQITHARVFLYNGNPLKAYALLTRMLPLPEDALEIVPLPRAQMFAEIMFAAREREEAEKWMRSIHVRLQTMDAPRLQAIADKLARQL